MPPSEKTYPVDCIGVSLTGCVLLLPKGPAVPPSSCGACLQHQPCEMRVESLQSKRCTHMIT